MKKFIFAAALVILPASALAFSADAPYTIGTVGASTPSFVVTQSGTVGVGIANPSGRKMVVQVGTTTSSENSLLVKGYQAAFEVMNQAGSQNWYFGIDDNDQGKLKIGAGQSAGQGVNPAITILSAGPQIVVGDTSSFTSLTGKFNVYSGYNDVVAQFVRDSGGGFSGSEAIIPYHHYSGSSIAQPIFSGFSARGTQSSPLALPNHDYLLILDGRGFDGAIFSDTSAQIGFSTDQPWTPTSHGSQIEFLTTPAGSIYPAERMRITSGGVYIGSTATLGGEKLGVTKTSPGSTAIALNLINNAGTANTAVALDFTPNVNVPLARITSVRTNDGGSSYLSFGVGVGAASNPPERMRISDVGAVTVQGVLGVGTSGAPKGVTLYDTANGTAYCVKVTNGALVPTPGACQ